MDEIRVTKHGHASDPRRRWLRNTFQEGPGFRFLATRSGRPPARRAADPDRAATGRRAGGAGVAREQGITAPLAWGLCSGASLFRWQAAFAAGGLAALRPHRRGPRRTTLIHPLWVEQVVIAVRLLTYWNSKRIAAELRRREIATVSEGWIEALFDRVGAARPSIASRGGGPRYERGAPNELWHIDIQGPFFIQLAPRQYLKTWIVRLLDGHSRYLLGLRVPTDSQAPPILIWLRDCIELCGKPLDLMSDNGPPFVVWMPGVLTKFGKTLPQLH